MITGQSVAALRRFAGAPVTENETNARRLSEVENRNPYVKDGINDISCTV